MDGTVHGTQGSADETEGTRSFRGKFGRKVGGLLAAASFMVLLFGTVPLWFSHRILKNAEQIQKLNEHIRLIEDVHITIHHVAEAGEDRTRGKKGAEEELSALSDKLRRALRGFETLHSQRAKDWAEDNKERRVFENIVQQSEKIIELASREARLGEEIRGISRAMMPLFTKMAALHQREINEVVAENRMRMNWIFSLYYGLIAAAVLVIIGGIFWVSRSIVRPITRLAGAAQEVAAGDFTKRVDVPSEDEVGRLSHSFNLMAERLKEHKRDVKRMAALEERERLAREMHDGLAQKIGFLNFKIAEIEERFSKEDPLGASGVLSSLRETVDGLYGEVRQAIFGLRIMVSGKLGLLPTLTEYLHEFSGQTGIRVNLLQGEGQIPDLPPETEIQLIRIIQEALSNVHKHAHATGVSVTFRREDEILRILIEDDGRGVFKTRAESGRKSTFGLQTMEERARSVGGSLEIREGTPAGTVVKVELPLSSLSRGTGTWNG